MVVTTYWIFACLNEVNNDFDWDNHPSPDAFNTCQQKRNHN